MRWTAVLVVGLVLAGHPVASKRDENVSFVDRLGCGHGLTPVATGIGPGSTLEPTFTDTTTRPVVQLSTQRSGFPPVAVTFSATPTPGSYERFDTFSPHRGSDLAEQYTLGALEVVRPDPAGVVGWETVLPAPQRLFFTMLDFEYDAEAATVLGFRNGLPVTPTIIPRAEAGGSGVAVLRHPDGSMIVTGNIGVDLDDYAPQVAADVVFTEPVDRVRVIQSNPTGAPESTSVEYSTMYGCQGLDVVKRAGAPRLLQTGATVAYDVPFTIIVGNTARPTDMAVYEPQVTDNLGPVDGISSLVATGPQPACAVNPAFDGNSQPTLLAGAGRLAGGESCTITYVARVSRPAVDPPDLGGSSAIASSRGAATDVSGDALTLPAVAHGDAAGASVVRFATAAPSARAGHAAAVPLGASEITAGAIFLLLGVLLVAFVCLRLEGRQAGT